MATKGCSSCCSWSNFLLYLQIYFLTVAYDIATGVLGLPVSLARSGLSPFIVSFTIDLIMQFLLVNVTTYVLQKSIAVQIQKKEQQTELEPKETLADSYNLEPKGDGDHKLSQEMEDETVALVQGDDDIRHPDLSMLSDMFLPKVLAVLFVIHVILTFMMFAMSYSLAGSQAFGELLHVRFIYIIPFFCWILNAFILFARHFIWPIVSILSIFKASILVVTVILAFIVGSFINRQTVTNFNHIMDSFLLGTMALGGIPLIMPYLFNKISYEPGQIRAFRWAVNLGIFTCFILDMIFCTAILDVVPQVGPCITTYQPNMYNNGTTSATVCLPSNYTLLNPRQNGQISTIPFIGVIMTQFPQYNAVTTLITVFIIVSVTVAYTITCTALCHTVDGTISTVWAKNKWKNAIIFRGFTKETIFQFLSCVLLFLVIFILAMTNPKGFIKIVERLVSFANNAAAGIFIYGMVFNVTHRKEFRSLPVPVPLTMVENYLQYLVPLYFNFAIIYDIVTAILTAVGVPY